MIKFKNEDKFFADLDQQMRKIERELNYTFRGFAVSVYHYIVSETPQWTGHAAANWNFSVNTPDFSEDKSMLYALEYSGKYPTPIDGPAAKGHVKALMLANARNAGRDKSIKLRTPVFITNIAVDEQRKEYIEGLEGGYGSKKGLREVNSPGHMIERAKGYFGNLGKISKAYASKLRTARL